MSREKVEQAIYNGAIEAAGILVGAFAAWLLMVLVPVEVWRPGSRPLTWWECVALSLAVWIGRRVWRAVVRRGAR